MTTRRAEPNRIHSNQAEVHDQLENVVKKHLTHPWQKPISDHTQAAFDNTVSWLDGFDGDLILDSCCGIGESTAYIASEFPEARVIGVDKSVHRVEKHERIARADADNYLLVRADVNDFWRLAVQANWKPIRHFLLYPNPYPKASQFNRRWHGSPAFAPLLALGGRLEVRSNWKIYIDEFVAALAVANWSSKTEAYKPVKTMTAFERKFYDHGQDIWRLTAEL